ncbi:MAG: holliday junction DNA helicase RuvA [Candidatus Tokpelaia sp. JSC161]|nr:MAG: holliday junction DNA helicase RuvA [Candidatus Tokpelaia sp. JSC161]
MIGKLKGFIEEIGEDHVILSVQDIGYVVYLTPRAFSLLPALGQVISLFIETKVREDTIRLFGFFSGIEREWFRLLQSVQGVGAKVALSVLGTVSPDELSSAIFLQDLAVFTRIPGIGKKVSERILIELKTKALAKISNHALDIRGEPMLRDALSALCNLGYSRDKASQAIAMVVKEIGVNFTSAMLIRFALKELVNEQNV